VRDEERFLRGSFPAASEAGNPSEFSETVSVLIRPNLIERVIISFDGKTFGTFNIRGSRIRPVRCRRKLNERYGVYACIGGNVEVVKGTSCERTVGDHDGFMSGGTMF
jgi:hypothetical protein